MTPPSHLSFPPGILREHDAVRLTVLDLGNGVVSLEKPAGVEAVEEALRRQIAENKPSACALGIARPQLVFSPETEISGLQILADKATSSLELWKNALGSAQFRFRYRLLARPTCTPESEFACSLPVAQHFKEARALVSHTTGKKSETLFRRLEKLGAYEYWEAETAFPRFHQIRLHAMECGLPIIGDALYGDVPLIRISELRPKKRLNKGEDKPLYAEIALHLASVSIADGTPGLSARTINAPLPNGFETLLKKLRARI